MAASSTTPTLGDAGYLRWLKAGQGLLELRRAISRITMRIMVGFHNDICRALPAAAAPGCSCKPENIKGKGMDPSCATCNHFLAEIRKAQQGKPIKYKHNSDPSKWATDPWEVAKVFMGPGQQKDNHGPEQTDCSNILLLWEQCTKFHGFIRDPALLTKVREARNHLMYKPDMTLSEAEMKDDFFQPMIDLLGDAVLSRQPDIEPNGVTNLEKVRDQGMRIFPEDELNVWLGRIQTLDNSWEELKRENEPVAAFLQKNPGLLETISQEWPKLEGRVSTLELGLHHEEQGLLQVEQSLHQVEQRLHHEEQGLLQVEQSLQHEEQKVGALQEDFAGMQMKMESTARKELGPGMRLDQIPKEKFERIANIVKMSANAHMRLREIGILFQYCGEIDAEDVVGTLRKILNSTAIESKPLQLFLNIFEEHGVSDSLLHSYLTEAARKDEPYSSLVEKQFGIIETMAEICTDAHVCRSVAAILQCPEEALHPESSVKQLLFWSRDNGQTIATLDELFKKLKLHPDVCTFLATMDRTGHLEYETCGSLVETMAKMCTEAQHVGRRVAAILQCPEEEHHPESSVKQLLFWLRVNGQRFAALVERFKKIKLQPDVCTKDQTGHSWPKIDVEIDEGSAEVGDLITKAMHRIDSRSSKIAGLTIRNYICHQDELEVLATLDKKKYKKNDSSISDHDALLEQLRTIADEVRIKVNFGELPQINYSCGKLGLGDSVVAGNKIAKIAGFVSNNPADIYALTVGHVFKGFRGTDCVIVDRWSNKISSNSWKKVHDQKNHIDVALIELFLCNGWQGSNALVVSVDPSGHCYPLLYKNPPGPQGTRMMLAQLTPYSIAVEGSVNSTIHNGCTDITGYILQSHTGGQLTKPGDSGTLVCSHPLDLNPSYVHAYAYISGNLIADETKSIALAIFRQMQQVANDAIHYEFRQGWVLDVRKTGGKLFFPGVPRV